jgi:hypothetical protein
VLLDTGATSIDNVGKPLTFEIDLCFLSSTTTATVCDNRSVLVVLQHGSTVKKLEGIYVQTLGDPIIRQINGMWPISWVVLRIVFVVVDQGWVASNVLGIFLVALFNAEVFVSGIDHNDVSFVFVHECFHFIVCSYTSFTRFDRRGQRTNDSRRGKFGQDGGAKEVHLVMRGGNGRLLSSIN